MKIEYMEDILSKKIGRKVIFLGNEAIVRGALESGVRFVTTYPGTPASEIGNTFFKIQDSRFKIKELYFEFSTNEKVAIEAAAGASFSGLRSLVAMKHFGLNVASDFLMPLCYSGVRAGLVLVVADDPGCSSSAQSEQDSRAYSLLSHIPTLEPSTPQECKDFIKLGFEISEEFKIPVMIRETTRVALQGGVVKLGKIVQGKRKGRFVKDPRQFVTMPPRVLEMHKELLRKIEKIRGVSEKSKINFVGNQISNMTLRGASSEYQNDPEGQAYGAGKSKFKNKELGIISSGISHLYVMEALKELNLSLPILKLGFFYPLPEKKVKNFIKNLKKVLVVEELEPYLEREVERLAKEVNPKLKVFGKSLLPEVGELRPEMVIAAVAKVANKKLKIENFTPYRNEVSGLGCKLKIPRRTPQLCPGCPYWLVFQAVKRAVDSKKVIFGGEIGCYMLAGLKPHNIQDYLFCMGSSVGIGHGIKKAGGQKLIAFVGDSSFFHAGIPALINTVFNKSNPLIVIMDNRTTAMTGQQPHPGAPAVPDGIKIEEVVRACGTKNLKIIDPINQQEFIGTVKDFMNKKEVSVIIARRPCIFVKR